MAKNFKSVLKWIAFALLVVGGINWGVVGLGQLFNQNWNLVQLIVRLDVIASIIYVLVGISAIYYAIMHFKK